MAAEDVTETLISSEYDNGQPSVGSNSFLTLHGSKNGGIVNGTSSSIDDDQSFSDNSSLSNQIGFNLNEDGSDLDFEDDSRKLCDVGFPENCVYFVTSQPIGKLLYIDSTNWNAIQEFPPITCAEDDSTKFVVSVSAQKQSMWALTECGSLYLYVFPRACKIRHQVHTFENQRYRPLMGGWTGKLLAVDRFAWSDHGGSKNWPREHFRLLNDYCWKWDADWKLCEVVDGQSTQKDGWLYAGNFTSSNFGAAGPLSMVRRRKWMRTMVYSQVSNWVKIDISDFSRSPQTGTSIFLRTRKRDFVGLAVGGSRLNGALRGHLSIWALTCDGRILFREGVCSSRPEGLKWRLVDSVVESVIQIVCSPTGATWLLTYSGSIAVRMGVAAKTPWGSKWVQIVPPDESNALRFQRISIGENSAWGVSASGQKVYYLPNIESRLADFKWIHVVGEMFGVYVGLNNQVWAVPLSDRSGLFFRDQVTLDEVCGRAWKKVEFQMKDVVLRERSYSELEHGSFCKIREVSATSFEGDPSMSLNLLSKSVKFSMTPLTRSKLVASFQRRDKREVVPFSKLSEYQKNSVIDVDFEAEKRSRFDNGVSVEVSTNLRLSGRNVVVESKFASCLLSLKSGDENLGPSSITFAFPESQDSLITFALYKIVCVRQTKTSDISTVMVNMSEPIEGSGYFLIQFQTYKDMFSWLDDFEMLKRDSTNTPLQTDSNLFFVDYLGSCFVHKPQNFGAIAESSRPTGKSFDWRPLKGHFSSIACYGNQYFGVTEDKCIWFCTAESASAESSGVSEYQTDCVNVTVEEVETWSMAMGYRRTYNKCHPEVFWNESGKSDADIFSCVQLPSTRWQWMSSCWTVDYTKADNRGWSYTSDLDNPKLYHSMPGRGDTYRKRTHGRKCLFKQKSSWVLVSRKPYIVQIAINNFKNRRAEMRNRSLTRKCSLASTQSSESFSNLVKSQQKLWGLDEDGVLYEAEFCSERLEDSLDSGVPVDHLNWIQVDTDHHLMSISAAEYSGGPLLVGLSTDAVTVLFYYKDYFTPIEGPFVRRTQQKLLSVCFGGDLCYLLALDLSQTLWIREGTSFDFPEGHSWTKLMNNVSNVSLDQDSLVWVVLSSYNNQQGVLACLYPSGNHTSYLSSAGDSLSTLNKKFKVHLVMGPNVKRVFANSFFPRGSNSNS